MRAEQRSGVLRPFFLAAALWLGAHAGAHGQAQMQSPQSFAPQQFPSQQGGTSPGQMQGRGMPAQQQAPMT
ncbi:MAG: hypothetical protein NTX90_11195, partial [Alphaproteobacteria bacterium]|nr:hypothetical protein [Alphaproteobacteria bacterium]